jgi:hypothetical protein
LVRCKRGEGATYGHRHKVQEEVFIALKRAVRLFSAARRFDGALENDSKSDAVSMVLDIIPPKNFSPADGRFWATGFPIEKKVPHWQTA